MDNVQKALTRIEGQVRGIAKMYGEQKPCLAIAQQLAAARAALGAAGREILQQEACRCMLEKPEQIKFAKILKQLLKN